MSLNYQQRKSLVIRSSVKQPSNKYAVLPSQLEHKEAIERMRREGYISPQNGQYILTAKAVKIRAPRVAV